MDLNNASLGSIRHPTSASLASNDSTKRYAVTTSTPLQIACTLCGSTSLESQAGTICSNLRGICGTTCHTRCGLIRRLKWKRLALSTSCHSCLFHLENACHAHPHAVSYEPTKNKQLPPHDELDSQETSVDGEATIVSTFNSSGFSALYVKIGKLFWLAVLCWRLL